MSTARVALAHDVLTQRGGAERVFLAMARAFPGSPILTTVYAPSGTYPEFAEHEATTSPLQHVRPLRSRFRLGLPLYPWAMRRLGPVGPRAITGPGARQVGAAVAMHDLISLGCDEGQGYLMSRPVTPHATAEMLGMPAPERNAVPAGWALAGRDTR